MPKYIKSKNQIAGIRKSCHAMAAIFRELEALVKPGVSTGDLELAALAMIEAVGGKPSFKGYKSDRRSPAFPTALCASLNNEIVHAPALPSRVLKAGDIIKLDCGMVLDGYFSDMARTFAVGAISKPAQHLINVTREALSIGIKQIKPGNTLNDIGSAIQKYVEGEGLGVVRELVGHGVGLAVHEDPQVPHYNIKEAGMPNVRLESGMVLAIEPMVTIGDWRIKIAPDNFTIITRDGSLAAQFENTIVVTDDGVEVLTDY